MRHPSLVILSVIALWCFFPRESAAVPIQNLVAEKCGACHGVPRPNSIRQGAWPEVLDNMVQHMEKVNFPITEGEWGRIREFYHHNSPVALPLIPDHFADSTIGFDQFTVGKIVLQERPIITGVRFLDLDGSGVEDDIIVTDANLGVVNHLKRIDGNWVERTLAKLLAPVDAEPIDVNGDGHLDLAISVIGDVLPTDDLIGEFHLLINRGDGTFEPKMILTGMPRITDAAAADFDGDGDVDFVLAMFGWRDTGAVGYLEQVAPGEFKCHEILKINGCMQVEINDVNGDGRPDFVALITQQHESILQFTNEGGGKFTPSYITRASHPTFGSSSIHLVDLDGDGDQDILYTNGDMMDENAEPKPYHGVQWLENDGKGTYQLHHLAAMPGCYDAVPVDMDGDGDLDIVVSSLHFAWDTYDFPSLIWLENTGGAQAFTPRRIAYAPTNLAKIAVGDANGDGKPDIIAGGMHVPGPLQRKGRLTMWQQQ